MTTTTIPILHFNDVYKITRPRSCNFDSDELSPINGNATLSDYTFDHVVQFSEKVNQIRQRWPKDPEREPQGLVLFSGDLFSPSVESMLTRGLNMVHTMNEIRPDACVPGNHEFDHGRERFSQLVEFSNFPWILSNFKEKILRSPGELVVPKGLCEYCIFERSGIRIGVVGLMSKVAIKATPIGARTNLVDSDMVDECRGLCKKLRKPKPDGGEKCDVVLALTHAEHFEDIALAKELYAYPANKKPGLEDLPGVDVVLGGHVHSYFLGEGVEADDRGDHKRPWEGDDGVLIVKSGMDFNELSEVLMELEDRPMGTERKKVIKSLKVIHHKINSSQDQGELRRPTEQPPMENTLRRLFRQEVLKGLNIPIAQCSKAIKVQDEHLRSKETAIGNWIADVLHERFKKIFRDDTIPTVLVLTGASIRGGFTLEGNVLARHIIQLMPFEVSLTSLDITGEDLKQSLNRALLEYNQSELQPRMSTRFPVVSGLRVKWDSSAKEDPIRELKLGDYDIDPQAKYRVVTSTYLASGGSGFDKFKIAKDAAGILPDGPAMYQAVRDYIKDLQMKQNLEELHSYASRFARSYNPASINAADHDILQYLVHLTSEMVQGGDFFSSVSGFSTSVVDALVPPEKCLPELSGLIPEYPDGRMVDVASKKSG